jgi:MATE family multidrug resistance protein
VSAPEFDLTNREWHRRFWRLAAPITLSNLSVPLLGVVDTAVVGHLPEPYYLGAVAVGALIFTFFYWGFGFLRMGTTGLTAQAWGSGDGDEVRAILVRALLIAAAIGVTIIVLQWPISAAAFSLLEASTEVEGYAAAYFAIRIWSAPAALGNYVVLGWFLGLQNARVPLALQVFINGLNIVLDLVFVLVLGWQVEGVALATVIAEYAGLALGMLFVLHRLKGEPAVATARVLDIAQFKRMFAVNRDIFIRTLCLIFCFAYFTAQSAKLGDVVLGANAVLMNFMALMSHGLDGFAHAAEALVGGAAGARHREGFRRAVVTSVFWACLVAGLFVAVYWMAGTSLIAILTGVPSVRETAAQYLPWVIFAPILSVWAFLLDGIFLGTTRTAELRKAMILSTVIYVATVQIALPAFGNHGLWLALMGLMFVRGASLGMYFPRVIRGIG